LALLCSSVLIFSASIRANEEIAEMEILSTVGTCQSFQFLSLNHQYNTTCAGTVDYDFFLPDGVSLAQLNGQATNKLKDSRLTFLDGECVTALKKQVCASIYLKCDSAGSNLHTYSAVPVPYFRPCRSLCTTLASQCWGMLRILQQQPNCSATYDYSGTGVSPLATRYDIPTTPPSATT